MDDQKERLAVAAFAPWLQSSEKITFGKYLSRLGLSEDDEVKRTRAAGAKPKAERIKEIYDRAEAIRKKHLGV